MTIFIIIVIMLVVWVYESNNVSHSKPSSEEASNKAKKSDLKIDSSSNLTTKNESESVIKNKENDSVEEHSFKNLAKSKEHTESNDPLVNFEKLKHESHNTFIKMISEAKIDSSKLLKVKIPDFKVFPDSTTTIASVVGSDSSKFAVHSGSEGVVLELNKLGVSSFWHMTHIDNLSEILSKGILSHNKAHTNYNKLPTDISDSEVQDRRKFKRDSVFNRFLHEYAPLYISIKNPMLYVRKESKQELVLLEISPECLKSQEFIFTDGNAASNSTCFFKEAVDLNKLPWDVIRSEYWSEFTDGKRKKCAEVLIHSYIEPKYIKSIHCFSHRVFFDIAARGVRSTNVKVSPELYFR